MKQPARPHVHRSERTPLYVQVLTRPALAGCWSVNVSETGIGLIARPEQPSDGPQEGQELELEFALPGGRGVVRGRGKVQWRQDGARGVDGSTAALGVRLLSFAGDDRIKLTRYLHEHQLTVVLAYADARTAALVRRALGREVQLHFAAHRTEVEELVTRGDVSALLICGSDEFEALALVQLVAGLAADIFSARGRPLDIAPPVVFRARAKARHLVDLFNSGKIFRALEVDCGEDALREAIASACRSHGVRTEQRRTALELQRRLDREGLRSGRLETEAAEEAPGFRSPRMRDVMQQVRTVAPHRLAVLLQGETGAGKEVLARAVHRLGSRREGPFVAQDCGALPETLLESELFGHVKGAFTGAVADRPGLFVLADSGTIFLDEIENTTPNFQSKLLRVLETGEVRPVGGTNVRQVDVRLIAASNRNLEAEVDAGRFRGDLSYRLNTFTIDVPPLRERPEDVLDLAERFLALFNAQLTRSASGLTEEARALLLRYGWPGNVRELRNVLERAVLLSSPDQPIGVPHLPAALVAKASRQKEVRGGRSLRNQLMDFERRLIQDALRRNDSVIRRAAAELDMDPVTLARRAKKLGLA